jgi:hypothetical protein
LCAALLTCQQARQGTRAANLISAEAGRTIKVRAVSPAVTRAAGMVAGPFVPMVKDMAAMFRWFDRGRYVADTNRQARLFGPVPTAEDAVTKLVESLRQPPATSVR